MPPAARCGGQRHGRRHRRLPEGMDQDGRQARRACRRRQAEAPIVLRGYEAAARRALLPDGRAHAGARSPGANGNVPQGNRGVSRSDGAWPRELRTRRDSVRREFHSRSARARARESMGPRRSALRQRPRQLQGAALLVGPARRPRPSRHFVAVDRPAGDGRNASHRRAAGDLRDGAMGKPGVRLARGASRRRREAHRHGGHFTRRPFRRPRRRQGTALRLRRGLGRESQLGRSAAEAPEARGREPGAALLEARDVGVRREGHG